MNISSNPKPSTEIEALELEIINAQEKLITHLTEAEQLETRISELRNMVVIAKAKQKLPF